MSKSQKLTVAQPEDQTLEVDTSVETDMETQTQPNRLEAFLKAKAAKQHFERERSHHFYGKMGHSKLKERVRRRP